MDTLISITPKELIQKFNDGKTIKFGCISVWNDSIGRPGDNIYTLSEVKYLEVPGILLFSFKKNSISLRNFKKILINNRMICIEFAEEIKWEEPDVELLYNNVDNNIVCKLIRGKHTFSTSIFERAFMFYD
jgi:hypothetical protein